MALSPLGETLYHDDTYKDLDLIIDDGHDKVNILVHRMVLKHSAPFFNHKLGGKFYFCYIWNVESGFIPSALQLIKFMYTRDLLQIRDIEITQKLCMQLDMCKLYAVLDKLRTAQNVFVKSLPIRTSPKKRRRTTIPMLHSRRAYITRSGKRIRC
jgi:hypothetical protein